VLDVRDPAAIAALAAELGEVDIVFSNATARMSPDADPVDEVDAVAETSDLAHNKLVMALCPGLIDTDASRPWFDDMSQAQTPAQAAVWPVKLALAPHVDPAFYGELVQFGKVLPWTSGIPIAHNATT
jgi:NAD(P)-dependent dehydrogenase (short-subunit alcohol dehydrogenase family)